jgi:cell pole-organizing protein PopZ
MSQHEPTMEEILASIRKIISEDAPAEAAPNPAPAEEPEVLELTEEVVEEPGPAENISFPAVPPASNDIFSDMTRKALDDTFAAIPAEEPTPMSPPPVDGSSMETVFERAVREGFEPVLLKYLSDNSGAVVESMKPAIREWMDEHFPALLEVAVRAELERMVKARGKR